MFSGRLPASLDPNRLASAVAAARAGGRPLIDLTLSNPTRAGFHYPDDLLTPLADPRGLRYDPQPFGDVAARDAIAADFRRRGLSIRPDALVLAASTSEAYSLLFKLLCDPGDEVLVPRPSYPLLEHLTRLDGITPVSYDLEYGGRWSVDVGSAERAFTPRTRALVLVSPNNPTGSYVSVEELERLAAFCETRGVAIIADEVFADYALPASRAIAVGETALRTDVLTFSLGGLSKSAGLPQGKLAWIAVAGPETLRRAALARLEVICDTYLSVSTPVQLAAAELIRQGAAIRAQIQERVARNHASLVARSGAAATPCRVLEAEGGWYGVVRVPALGDEEDLALALLDQEGVMIHPGYFFDFQHGAHLIVSLLVPEAAFDDGVDRIFRHFDCSGGAP